MLKTFLFAAIVANLAVFSVSDSTETTSETEACGSTYTNTLLEEYMSNNGYTTTEIEIMTRASNAFTKLTMQCLYNMFRSEPNKNHVTTLVPLFKMLAAAADGQTGSMQEETLSVLNLNSLDEMKTVCPIVETMINTKVEEYESAVAMQMYGDNDYPFHEQFIFDVKEITNITVDYVDYSYPAEAVTTMNAWVKNVAGYDVEDLISEEDMYHNNGANIVGISTLKLYVNKLEIFEDGDDMTFYKTTIDGTSETKSVPSVHLLGDIQVATVEEYDATVLGIPMVNDCYTKIMYTSKGGNDFANMIYAMEDYELFYKMMALGEVKRSHVYIPKFTSIKQKKDFVTGLKLSGLVENLLVRNETAVCNSVFEGSDACGYLSNMMHEIDLSIENSCAETTDEDGSDCTDVINVDQNFIYCYTCPIGAPHVCAMYLGA